MDYASGQIFRHPRSGNLLFVRQEARNGVPGVLLVGARDRVILTRWLPESELEEAELINDNEGRLDAAQAKLEMIGLKWEVKAYKDLYKKAFRDVPPSKKLSLKRALEKIRSGDEPVS